MASSNEVGQVVVPTENGNGDAEITPDDGGLLAEVSVDDEDEEDAVPVPVGVEQQQDVELEHSEHENDSDDETIDHFIDPPATWHEQHRDGLLRLLDSPVFQVLGLIILFSVILFGAIFFFFLMGWQTVCRPRTDCEPRNWIYNMSIQALNGCFTYMSGVAMTWRCTNFLHSTGSACPRRSNEVGHDLYGLPTTDIWFWVPRRRRCVVLFFLILNALTQFANQATRIVYWNYELQDVSPGNIWTNVFFIASFLFAAIGGILLVYYQSLVRKEHPSEFFLPGPLGVFKDFVKKHRHRGRHCCCKKKRDDDEEEAGDYDDEQAAIDIGDHERPPSLHFPDPTREVRRRAVLPVSRQVMRLWGM